jgi:hypothetical protein
VQGELVVAATADGAGQAGQTVGTMKVSLDGKPYGEYPVSPSKPSPVGRHLWPRHRHRAPLVQLISQAFS